MTATGRSSSAARRGLMRQVVGGVVVLTFGRAVANPGHLLAVVYPELADPFRQVFASILDGIEDRQGGPVPRFAVPGNASPAQIADDIRRRDPQVLIGLGRSGMRVASAMAGEMAVLVGCVVSVQEAEARAFPVHTLAPDPALMLGRLRRLRPGVRRVHLVYDPQVNTWLVRLAREAARAEGLELLAQEAGDTVDALRIYTQVMSGADAVRDALWLPQDPTTVDENAVLSLVLREGWNRNVAVFSSHLAHVKRGALFALYPDNRELGRSLALAAQRLVGVPRAAPAGVQPLRQALAAINVRTAAHLGVDVAAVQPSFDLVYPTT
ncbi:ABC transporter substrate binding protein [Roseateles sp. BYS96W]|uniref:ABC transporter substrate binding protein n=1 Tax=Pelomonas nitida TaxID=3299027 RepID=A0ABW7G7X4_9BURK